MRERINRESFWESSIRTPEALTVSWLKIEPMVSIFPVKESV